MRVRTIQLCAALAALSMAGLAQIDPRPKDVRSLTKPPAMSEFSLASVVFQEIRMGHEGPGYANSTAEPAKATRQVARIRLYSHDAVRSVRFEAIDATGRMIAPVPAIRVDHDPQNGEYMVLVDIPQQPFRIRAAGVDLTGAAYERVHRRLFQPVAAKPSAKPADPLEAEFLARFEAEKKLHPDGTITISPIDVSSVGYEPLVVNSNVIGMRVWYSARFQADGVYSLAPHVFPVYENFDWRGLVTMRVLREKVTPLPEVPEGTPVQNLLQFGAAAKYRSGIDYRVVLEMIPDYIIPNTQQTKFCIYEAKFPAEGKNRDSWNQVRGLPTPVEYSVNIPGLNFVGKTEVFHPQRTFYEAFLKQGAFDCGPSPNSKF